MRPVLFILLRFLDRMDPNLSIEGVIASEAKQSQYLAKRLLHTLQVFAMTYGQRISKVYRQIRDRMKMLIFQNKMDYSIHDFGHLSNNLILFKTRGRILL